MGFDDLRRREAPTEASAEGKAAAPRSDDGDDAFFSPDSGEEEYDVYDVVDDDDDDEDYHDGRVPACSHFRLLPERPAAKRQRAC